MGILMKSVGVIQGYAIVAGLFDIRKITETRQKIIKMDNFFYIFRLQLERIKGIWKHPCKKVQETANEHDYLYKTTTMIKRHFRIFVSATSFPFDSRPHSHKIFTMLIQMFGISGVLYHGWGRCSIKSFFFG